MAPVDDELKNLKEINNELVQKVQYWKMTAAQRESEKVELLKEVNELRLKVIRLKSGGAASARKIDSALQSASKEALSHLVQASDAIARTMQLAKTYMRDREELETVSPRWSNISNTTDKVHRVPPMMFGGQSIQPVVSLSRTLNLSAQRSTARSPNSNRNVTVRAVPMHMLQDVYIPLTRIDMRDIPNNDEPEQAANESAENVSFETSMEEPAEESQNTNDISHETSQMLDVVTEEMETDEEIITPPRPRVENPLEGPSWLLDARRPLEPDSTTHDAPAEPRDSPEAPAFTPTVRRRKRAEPAPTPAPQSPRRSTTPVSHERVLQVLVPKMQLECSPAKRVAAPFDAPSPNGATDSRVIVSEELARAKEARPSFEAGRGRGGGGGGGDEPDGDDSRLSGGSDSGAERASEGRTRRNRKPVTYKEKPLNREELVRAKEARPSFEAGRGRGGGGGGGDEPDGDDSRLSGGSDSGAERASEGRTRRNRKPVTYKEKPLNRKLRR